MIPSHVTLSVEVIDRALSRTRFEMIDAFEVRYVVGPPVSASAPGWKALP